MNKVLNSSEFSRLIRNLANDVVYANIHWKLYRDLCLALAEKPIVASQSNTFWFLTVTAHQATAAQYLCRAFDQQSKALSLQSWLKEIRRHLHLFTDAEFRIRLAANPFVESLAQHPRRPDLAQLNVDIRECSENDSVVRKLIIYRNNVAAHRNAKAALTDSAATFTIPVASFEVLLARATAVLNRYSNLFAAETHSTTMVGKDDYRYIFSTVADAVERSLAESEALLERHRRESAS